MAYEPAGLADVAVVVSVGGVVRLAGESPLTNPEYDAVSAGTACPATMDSSSAVMVSGAGVTVSVLPTRSAAGKS